MASRTPRGSRRRQAAEPSFPVLPIAIGVVILGFAIGAGFNALRRQHGPVVALASATPAVTPAATAPPTEARTSPAPSARPSPRRSPHPTPHPHPSPSHTPRGAAPTPTAAPMRTTEPPPPSPPARAAPTAAPLKRAAAVGQAASPAPEATASADTPLLRDARQTVRTYLEALAAGDEATAQAQLLANAGTSEARLSEKDFLDAGARIVDMTATATSPSTATVDVDVRSAKGLYYVHYELRRLDTGVTLIREHNYAKT